MASRHAGASRSTTSCARREAAKAAIIRLGEYPVRMRKLATDELATDK